MTYTYGKYSLYYKDVELKGGRKQRIYFFSKKPENQVKGTATDLPEGKEVSVNKRTGLPLLKNKK